MSLPEEFTMEDDAADIEVDDAPSPASSTLTTASVTSSASIQSVTSAYHEHPWPYLRSFFDEICDVVSHHLTDGRVSINGKIKCKLGCNKQISFNSLSTANLKSHVDRMHHSHATRFNETCKANRNTKRAAQSRSKSENSSMSPAPKRMVQASLLSTFAKASPKYDSKVADKLFMDFMVQEMLPAKLVDSPALRKWATYLNREVRLPSRKTFMRRLKDWADGGRAKVMEVLSKADRVATTADLWTAHNRSFLGMTAHWLDANLQRMTAVLCCKELSVKHTFDVVARAMWEVHCSYNIEGKLVCTTTDNGSNFVKAFKEYVTEVYITIYL